MFYDYDMKKLIKTDMHIHTYYSSDGRNSPDDLIDILNKRNIDKIFITDHNTIQGALEFKKYFPDRIFIGEEVKTISGELILYFVKEEIPTNLTLTETIELAKEQKCFISVPHPLDIYRNSAIGFKNLESIKKLIDAVEVFNSRCLREKDNHYAYKYAKDNKLFITAGSDAHIKYEIGQAGLLIPDFNDVESFRISVSQAEFFGKLSSPLVHIPSTLEKFRKKFFK